jgi:polysaccharide deacetylase 2 family uncharacterized protein YibQ
MVPPRWAEAWGGVKAGGRRVAEATAGRGQIVARGFLAGILAGGVVSVLGLGTVSLLGEQPPGNTPPDAPQVDAPESDPRQGAAETALTVAEPGAAAGPSLGAPPAAETPASPSGDSTDTPATKVAPPDVPQASGVEGEMPGPGTGDSDAPYVGGGDPVRPDLQSPALGEVGRGDRPRQAGQDAGNGAPADRDTGAVDDRPTEAAPDPGTEAPGLPALRAHAAPAAGPDGLPTMAIVLIDAGQMAAGPALVASLPFPVTVAIDPAADGAAELLAAYRAEGVEAVIRARLPEGATPQDVEVALEGSFADLSETVALLDIDAGSLGSREATEQMMQILAEAGRGYLSRDRELNTAGRLAEQAGVPATTIFRDLDGAGQDASAIRRLVDRAAARARQDGGVVLLGRLRPDMVTALINWGNDKRAVDLAQVPGSAVLREAE